MPTYEYRCQACGHELEAFQSMKDQPLTDCPSCSAPSLKRQISLGAGMIFKGAGFYETDYRRKTGESERECPVLNDAKPEAKTGGCAGGCACHSGN